MNDQVYDMACGVVWIVNMNHEEEQHQKIGGLREVDMAKDGLMKRYYKWWKEKIPG